MNIYTYLEQSFLLEDLNDTVIKQIGSFFYKIIREKMDEDGDRVSKIQYKIGNDSVTYFDLLEKYMDNKNKKIAHDYKFMTKKIKRKELIQNLSEVYNSSNPRNKIKEIDDPAIKAIFNRRSHKIFGKFMNQVINSLSKEDKESLLVDLEVFHEKLISGKRAEKWEEYIGPIKHNKKSKLQKIIDKYKKKYGLKDKKEDPDNEQYWKDIGFIVLIIGIVISVSAIFAGVYIKYKSLDKMKNINSFDKFLKSLSGIMTFSFPLFIGLILILGGLVLYYD